MKTVREEIIHEEGLGYVLILKKKTREYHAIMCLTCGTVSHNLNDCQNKFCGKCDKFHEGLKVTA